MELEIPEIYDNIVELYKIVREPGYRTKIAVISHREDVDSVGACVGPKGARIQTIITELEGEKIDVIEYSSDPAVFIANALSPAEVLDVIILDEEKHTALAVVAETQLSIAIGKQGLNVRLANRLADWSIDVKTEKQVQEMDIHAESRKAAEELFNDDAILLTEVEGIDPDVLALLHEHHIETVEQLLDTPHEQLCAFPGMSAEKARALETLINESFEIINESQDQIMPASDSDAEEVYECPECGAPITIDMTVCPNCGVGLSFEYEDEE